MKSSFWDRSSRYNQLQTVRSCAGWVAPLFFIANVFAQTAPTVLTQPQSQAAIAGTNVTLSVIAAGGAPPPLPAATSGNLRLWLKADTGVITNSAGHVSQWQDQSGNANHAAQTDANEQPLLASATGLAGNPVVRFNGIQDGVNGDYLQGAGDVGVSNAMTTFVVYNVFSTTNAVDLVWLIGVPGVVYGASRADCVIGGGDMLFSTWTYDYPTSFAVPTNTYRIWTDRINTNLTTLEMFDNSAHGSTNFALAMANAVAPAPGYYVGGLNPSVQYVATSRCFDGDIAELICYRGYLTDADRMAVTNYLGQKYFQIGSNNLTYQWQFDGTNIANATNATLTMTDLQITNDGVYTVIVSNLAGVTTSSNAVLTVGNAPSISVQPQSQEVGQGSNVTFTVSVTGTAPFSFQWSLGGVALAGSTNSALTLTNVQSATAGAYAVTVSSPFGTSVSSNVTLTVDLFPVIETQPQSQALLVGTNVTFSVNVEGSVLPSVSSGTLQLWLKADAGVVTNSAGQVSQWQDQSGNANHASQSVANNQPTLVSAARLAGKPAIRFNGIQDNVNGDYLSGTGNVDVPNALTTFAVYNYFANEPNGSALWIIGQPPTYGSIRADAIVSSEIDFSTWGYDSYSPFTCPTNTYRIWTSVLNSNLTAVQVYDNSATDSNSFSASMANFVTPAAGYYVGGVNPVIPSVGSSRCYDGDVVELVCYSGSLTDIDRLAVLGYLQEKYFAFIDIADLSYQWQFDGTNIYNATNASLVLTNLQTAEAGTYTVTVSNLAGVVTSSNAVLTVLSPPVFTSSPSNQSVVAGVPVVFSAAATGTLPIAYQWQFNGVSITNATNTSLTFSDPLAANAGSYTLVATNLYGSATSQVATLSVAESALQVVSASALGGGTVVVSIDLNALGTENFVGFTLNFDPTLLTYSGAVLGSNVGNGSPLINSGSVASGLLGLQAIFPIGSAIPAGTQDLFDVTFQVRPVTNSITTPVTFGSQIIQEWISDVAGNQLPATFASGTVAITVTAIEGDVWPRPNGDHVVTGSDWVEEGLIVAGLVTNLSPSEFQRADCAPRTTLGDGVIDCADWVQVGRYAAGLDPVTVAGGPTGPISQTDASRSPRKADLPRPIAIVPLSQGAATNTVVVQLTASGAEAALGFSVRFDPKMVRFVSASKGSGAGSTASLIQNTNQAAAGSLGFVIGVLSPATFAPGALQLVNLNFASVSCSNNTTLVFSDTPVARQLVDASAAELPASYQTVTLAVGGAAWPVLSISQAGSNVVLTWPATGAALGLQAAPLTGMEWSNLPATPATIGSTLVVTSSMSTNVGFFRLKY
jgi:hypothetical protein